MKQLLAAALLLFLAIEAGAHPGKTDVSGGHKCYKACEEWGLSYAEYHLHDKDGRPIRIKKGMTSAPSLSSDPVQTAGVESAPVTTVTRTVVEYRTITREEVNVFPFNPYLSILLLLLLMLLIVSMNRRKKED